MSRRAAISALSLLRVRTFLREYFPGPIKVEALSHFPIERDLVVDAGDFLRASAETLAAKFLQQIALRRCELFRVIDPFRIHRSTRTSPRFMACVAAEVRSETPILSKMFIT